MQRIAMSQTGRVEQGTIIVDGCRTVGYLVAAVTIDIAHAEAMRTLSVCRSLQVMIPGLTPLTIDDIVVVWRCRGMKPLRRKFLAVEVYSPEM